MMGALSNVVRSAEDGMLLFWCPGCDGAHGIKVGSGAGPRWSWNGNAEKPTFTPSILVRGTELSAAGELDRKRWEAAGFPSRNGIAFDSVQTVCHSFVTDGRIQFLGDCTHALAGQTVDLPSWDKSC